MAATTLENEHLTRWRINSPFIQVLLLGCVVFCVPGMNSTVLGLGAGGSRPENIPIVDKVNIVGASITIPFGFVGGSINNQIGPRHTLMLAASGYPVYVGALWWLDKGSGVWFAYVAGVWHGVSAALFYSAAGYIVSSYSSELERGRYIASFWAFVSIGSFVSAAVVLGITATRDSKAAHVPSAVYITIIAVQSVGVLFAALLANPSKVRRNDGRPIAHFKALSWAEELKSLPRTLFKPKLLLLGLAFFACQMPVSLSGSVNAFYFNARTRALVNFVFWLSAACGSVINAFLCDSRRLGDRRQRALLTAMVAAVFTIGSWAALLWFLSSRNLDRSKKPWGTDWSAGSSFAGPLSIYVFVGCTWALFQGYIQWLASTFSNEPKKLGRFSGYMEALRALGFAVAFGIDSNSVPFLTEAAAYFALIMAAIILCAISASRYTKDTKYGSEEGVIVPVRFEAGQEWVSENNRASESKNPLSGVKAWG